MLKEFLSKKGIQYVSKDVSVDPMAAQEMVAQVFDKVAYAAS